MPLTTNPSAKPASMIDTWVLTASADSANKRIRLMRSSSASSCRFEYSCIRLRAPLRAKCRSTKYTAPAHAAIATTPSAARGAPPGSITNGSRMMQAASAMAICALTDSTDGPSRLRPSITGSATAADDEAMSTAYRAA